MKIGMITQWYDPEPGPAALPGVLARELVRRGHEVTVVTGFPNYPTGDLTEGYRIRPRMTQTLDGVRVVRTALYPDHGGSAVGRLLNYGSFALSSAVFGVPALKGVQVVWVNYSPITVALPMFLARALHRVPMVCEVADLWPDTLLVSGFSPKGVVGRAVAKGLAVWTGAMYRASDAVVHIAPSVGALLRQRGVGADRTVYIPKPGNEAVFERSGADRRAEWGIPDDAVVLLYAGSMGVAQGLDTLMSAMDGVDSNRLVCLMAGGGTQEGDLRAVARNNSAVRFLGRLPQEQMPDLMATADVAYISLVEDPLTPLTLPSKTQATMAAGLPALVAASGDVVDVIEQARAGFAVDQADPADIRRGIDRLVDLGRSGLRPYGSSARDAYERQFSVRATTEKAEQLLATVAGDGCRAGDEAAEFAVVPLQRRHVREAAALHRRAFPDFFLSQLGEGFLREFYAGFLSDPDAVTSVVEDGQGRVAAVAVGSTQPAGFFSRLLRRRLVGFGVQSALAAARDPRRAPRLLAAVRYRGATPGDGNAPGQGALLSSICTDPDQQGRGLGARVLRAWTERAGSLGADSVYLTTDADGNDAVNDFYRRAGWQLDGTFTTPQGRRMHRYTTTAAQPAEAGALQ